MIAEFARLTLTKPTEPACVAFAGFGSGACISQALSAFRLGSYTIRHGSTMYDTCTDVETSPPPRPVLEQTLAGAFRVTTQLHALGALQGKIRVFCIHVVMS